jgi:hypothetical protein
MLFGFELFSALRSGPGAEVIEVYPFAIVRALLPSCKHKSTEKGYRDQLTAVADRTGWKPHDLEADSKRQSPEAGMINLTHTWLLGLQASPPNNDALSAIHTSRMTRSGCLRSPPLRFSGRRGRLQPH